MELDHFFILTEPPAAQAGLLADIGLLEGAPNDYPGQVTSNRRFFFSNCALELLYVRDSNEAKNGPGRCMYLAERTSQPASPFGLILRGQPGSPAPFAGWNYQPDYFEVGCSFLVGDNSDLLVEPLCMLMPTDPPSVPARPTSVEPFSVVTELRIHVPVRTCSPVLDRVSGLKKISLHTGAAHLLEVVFNNGQAGEIRDFRPELPLVIQW